MKIAILILQLLLSTFFLSENNNPIYGTWYLKSKSKEQLLFVRNPTAIQIDEKCYRIELFFKKKEVIYKSILLNKDKIKKHIDTQFYTWEINKKTQIIQSEISEQFNIYPLKIRTLNEKQLIFCTK